MSTFSLYLSSSKKSEKPDMRNLITASVFICIFLVACQSPEDKTKIPKTDSTSKSDQTKITTGITVPPAAIILKRKEIPILCYHQIRDWRPTDSKNARSYIVPVSAFREQLKMLADSGYHTILPDELYAYLTKGKNLPARSIMLTYDDTDLDQYTVALPEMKKYGFKGVFFI